MVLREIKNEKGEVIQTQEETPRPAKVAEVKKVEETKIESEVRSPLRR